MIESGIRTLASLSVKTVIFLIIGLSADAPDVIKPAEEPRDVSSAAVLKDSYSLYFQHGWLGIRNDGSV